MFIGFAGGLCTTAGAALVDWCKGSTSRPPRLTTAMIRVARPCRRVGKRPSCVATTARERAWSTCRLFIG
jgi:hypothetical protein